MQIDAALVTETWRKHRESDHHCIPKTSTPPNAGSSEERLETALVVGFGGAAALSCRDVEQAIRSLLWES